MISRTWKRWAVVAALVALGLPLVGASAGNADAGASPAHALCPDDTDKEPGLQGEVPEGETPDWDCGIDVVSHIPGAAGAMAVAAHCAYTGGGADETEHVHEAHAGVRVIDVSDPATPRVVRVLDTGSRELLAAQVAPDGSRALLATRHRDTEPQEGQVQGRDMLVDVWDLKEKGCSDPQLLGTVRLPTNSDLFGDIPGELGGPAHNLKFNPSATKLYGSIPPHEIDLADLSDPSSWTVRNLQCTLTTQRHVLHAVPGSCEHVREVGAPFGAGWALPQIDHEPTFSPDGSRLYIGGQLPYPDSNGIWVLDVTGPDPRLVSYTDQAPGHSIDYMTVRDRRYLLHSNEISVGAACVPESQRPSWLGWADRAFVLDITEEAAPVKVSEIRLAISSFDNCGRGQGRGPSTAYHEVDDEQDTTYAVIGFEAAGHRIFDLRDPAKPVEVAYFNRGRSAHTKSYVIPETGHIWASNERGFWVLDLTDAVKQHLGLRPPSIESCAGDGWQTYSDADGRPFASHGRCVSFATRTS